MSSNAFVPQVQIQIAIWSPFALAQVAMAVTGTAADIRFSTRKVTAMVEKRLASGKHPGQTRQLVMRNAIGAPMRK